MNKDERKEFVDKLRNEGETYKQIAQKIGVTIERVRQIHLINKPKQWHDGLSTRTAYCLLNAGINSFDDLISAYKSGLISTKKIKNYGTKSHRELIKWMINAAKRKGIKIKIKPIDKNKKIIIDDKISELRSQLVRLNRMMDAKLFKLNINNIEKEIQKINDEIKRS